MQGKELNCHMNAGMSDGVARSWKIIEIDGAQGDTVIEDAQEKLRYLCIKSAQEEYGDTIPETVEVRLLQELNNIFENHDETIYLTLADVLLQEGVKPYQKNIRGLGGSSLVAYLCGITDMNPMEAHYICTKCHYIQFVPNKKNLHELEKRVCPHCGKELERDGYGLDYRWWLEPSGNILPHFVFGMADSKMNAVKSACESTGVFKTVELGTVGSRISALPNKLLNLLEYLVQETGVDITHKDFDESIVMKLLTEGEFFWELHIEGQFQEEILAALQPQNGYLLSKVVSLSFEIHNWNYQKSVWDQREINAETVIATGEDLVDFLCEYGMEKGKAFEIAKIVSRKSVSGKRSLDTQVEADMRKLGIPEWCIAFCKQVYFLPSRAHALSYIRLVGWLGYYRLNHHKAYEKGLEMLGMK